MEMTINRIISHPHGYFLHMATCGYAFLFAMHFQDCPACCLRCGRFRRCNLSHFSRKSLYSERDLTFNVDRYLIDVIIKIAYNSVSLALRLFVSFLIIWTYYNIIIFVVEWREVRSVFGWSSTDSHAPSLVRGCRLETTSYRLVQF